MFNYFISRLILCALSVLLIEALLLNRSSVAADNGEWRVAAWGEVQPSFEFENANDGCARGAISSSFFKVISRGNGDAEVVFSRSLQADRAYMFTAWLRTDKVASVDIFFRREDFPYDSTAIISRKISNWTYVELRGIHTSPGNGAVRIKMTEEDVSLCINSPQLVEISPSNIGAPKSTTDINSAFFGIHINHLGRHNGWPSFDPGTLRLWDTGTTWADIQPKNASIDWLNQANAKRLDYYTYHGRDKHPNLQFIYTLGMTPAWAATSHSSGCSNSPYGPSVCKMPLDLDDWRSYIKALAVRYKGIIQIWELWNEADLKFHWDGKAEEMAVLARIASEELKNIDPYNRLIGPNITAGGMQFLMRFFKAGGATYIDGISIHANPNRIPERSFAQIRNLRRMLEDMGLREMPIWNTEPKVSCEDLSTECAGSESGGNLYLNAEDALAQALIGNAALGVKSFVYYTWEGAATHQGNAQLVDDSYKTTTKAGLTFGIVKNWLRDATANYVLLNHGGLNVVQVDRKGVRSLIAWSSGSPKIFDLREYRDLNHYMRASEGINHSLRTEDMIITNEPVLFFSYF